jgi:hypothetical protein
MGLAAKGCKMFLEELRGERADLLVLQPEGPVLHGQEEKVAGMPTELAVLG